MQRKLKKYLLIVLSVIVVLTGIVVWGCKNPNGPGVDWNLRNWYMMSYYASGPGLSDMELSYNSNGQITNIINPTNWFGANKTLFKGSNNNHYRIPAIITWTNGDILAFADKRYNSAGDLPNRIEVMVKISTNNGTNWCEEKRITPVSSTTDDGHGDTAVVLDRKTGDILAFVAHGQGFIASTPQDPIRIRVIRSKDGGKTWATPVDITSQIYGAGCSDYTRRNWHAAFVSSGNGLQLRNGRIMFVINVRETEAKTGQSFRNYVMYSDDGGYKWKVSRGCPKNHQGGNEAKIVELNQEGHLLMNIRPNGPEWNRLLSRSYDYGETWTDAKVQSDLPSSGSNGDMIYYTSTKNGYDRNRIITLVDSRAWGAGTDGHKGPGIPVFYISYDEGQTWTKKRTLWSDNAGYSSLTICKDGSIGILAELTQSWNGPIWFLRASVEWCDGTCAPSLKTASSNSKK